MARLSVGDEEPNGDHVIPRRERVCGRALVTRGHHESPVLGLRCHRVEVRLQSCREQRMGRRGAVRLAGDERPEAPLDTARSNRRDRRR